MFSARSSLHSLPRSPRETPDPFQPRLRLTEQYRRGGAGTGEAHRVTESLREQRGGRCFFLVFCTLQIVAAHAPQLVRASTAAGQADADDPGFMESEPGNSLH